MTGVFLALLRRDLAVAARVGGSGALGLVFFLGVVAVIPFGLGPDLNLLSRIGPAILWIAGLLATLIGLDRMFQADEEDGSLQLMRLSPAPLELIVLGKAFAHWLTTGLPLALCAPLFGLLLGIEPDRLLRTAGALLVGTPALTFLGAIGAALTATLRRGGLILAVTILPLTVPTLIFGVAAAEPAGAGSGQALLVLAALSLAAGAVGTLAAAAALRVAE